jgi:hypothetical protein
MQAEIPTIGRFPHPHRNFPKMQGTLPGLQEKIPISPAISGGCGTSTNG